MYIKSLSSHRKGKLLKILVPLKNILLICWLSFYNSSLKAQTSVVYENLPVGKYAVGFKIITFLDESRMAKPEYNYMGEKNEGDRHRKITFHLWYPATNNDKKNTIDISDYSTHYVLTSTKDSITAEEKSSMVNGLRSNIERFFGKSTDEAWLRLTQTKMLARREAELAKEKFPLLIGTLRPFSTTITNELLASNGYIVAMMVQEDLTSFIEGGIRDVPSLQLVINYLRKSMNTDENNIGAFGFSGSGVIPIYFAMHDPRVKALADLETALFDNDLLSDYYDVKKLRVPFMHIYSRELAKRDKNYNELYKMKFAKRYHMVLNQQNWHHWNIASEGFLSCIVLQNRGTEQDNIRRSFEIANIYLLNFFNAELKSDPRAKSFLANKPVLPHTSPSLWDIDIMDAVKPAPNRTEFEYIISKKGIAEALAIVNSTLKNDSTSALRQGGYLNSLGYGFLNEKKYEDAIGIFKLNAELHPEATNWIDSLAEAYERSGDNNNMKKISQQVLDILNKKAELTNAEKNLKTSAEKRIAK